MYGLGDTLAVVTPTPPAQPASAASILTLPSRLLGMKDAGFGIGPILVSGGVWLGLAYLLFGKRGR
jgi:hypothetical protein